MYKLALVGVVLAMACGGAKEPDTSAPAPMTKPVSEEKAQTFAEGMRGLCDAVKDPTVVSSDAANKATLLKEALERAAVNPEVRQVYDAYSAAGPEAKRGVLVPAIGKAGIAEADCELMKLWPAPSGSHP